MHPRRLALILTALVVAASPAAAEAATIDAGSLRARTASDPWRLDFVDGAGRSVLREPRGEISARPGRSASAPRRGGSTPPGS